MEKIENVSNPEVGKMYLVKCAKIKSKDIFMSWAFKGLVVPLIAEAHEDREFIKFNHVHYHIDWRFIDKATFEACTDNFLFGSQEGRELALVVAPEDFVWKEYRVRKYKRDFSRYPGHRAGWLPELEKAFANKKLSVNMVCPHKGASLKACRHQEGIVTCPLHGLQWSASTRELIPRS